MAATVAAAVALILAVVGGASAVKPCVESPKTLVAIHRMNADGPYLGIIVPNAFELSPLLSSPAYKPNPAVPYIDHAGRRFRFATIGKEKAIIVLTGLAMLNAGTTTELLLALFHIKAVVHFGIAGNADSNLIIGDVTIPQYWAHTGLWNWQRLGDGVNDLLAFEASGDYTRKYGRLNFSDYPVGVKAANALNSVWYQPEEVFPITGTPEERQHAFWVPVDPKLYALAKKLEGMVLPKCLNTTCLPRNPKVVRVDRGVSANVFVDNAAYRQFLRTAFNATAIDMETAAVALVALQQKTKFIAVRSLSDLAGGGSALSNEAGTFAPLAAQNAVAVAVELISLLS